MRIDRLKLAAVALALGLAACSAPPVLPSDTPSYGEIVARFDVARDDQVITIRALDRRAVTAAALVMPDGRRIAAYSIDTQANPTSQPFTAMPGNTTDTLIGQIASAALIRVEFPSDYAVDWQKARLEVTLGQGADTETRSIPAPAPPPARQGPPAS
jgi:hypothetical protein